MTIDKVLQRSALWALDREIELAQALKVCIQSVRRQDLDTNYGLVMFALRQLSEWYEAGAPNASLWYDHEGDEPYIEASWGLMGCEIVVRFVPLPWNGLFDEFTARLFAKQTDEYAGGDWVNWEIWMQGRQALTQLPDVIEQARRTYG